MRCNPKYDVYSCNADAVLPDGDRAVQSREVSTRRGLLGIEDIIAANRISIAAMVRASNSTPGGGFTSSDYVEDYDLWLRLLARGARHIHNPESLVLYRSAAEQVGAIRISALDSMAEVYRHLLSTEPLDGAVAAAVRDQLAATHRDVGRLRAQDDRASLSQLAAGDYAGAKATVLVIKKGFHSP